MESAQHRQLEEVAGWQAQLASLQARIGVHFRRPEVRARAGRYLEGLLSRVERKNGWQLAEETGERTPDGVQRLLRTACWEADALRDDLRAYVAEQLADPEAVLVVDETGFLKKGIQSVGVRRQYSGTAGRIENCQVGVFLVYAAARGRAFVDRELYLPRVWTEDHARRERAGVPEAVVFRTKPQLAQLMLERTLAAGVEAAWVTGDEVYGNAGALRRWLEEQEQAHVLAVASNHRVWQEGRQMEAANLVQGLAEEVFQRLAVGEGSKGPRVYDWACWPLPHETAEGWGRWLLVRRSPRTPQETAYYRVFAPTGTPLVAMARAAGSRWSIEESFERAKGEVGLDQYEVRKWTGWYRYITLSLLAHAFLEVTRAAAAEPGGEKGDLSP